MLSLNFIFINKVINIKILFLFINLIVKVYKLKHNKVILKRNTHKQML